MCEAKILILDPKMLPASTSVETTKCFNNYNFRSCDFEKNHEVLKKEVYNIVHNRYPHNWLRGQPFVYNLTGLDYLS